MREVRRGSQPGLSRVAAVETTMRASLSALFLIILAVAPAGAGERAGPYWERSDAYFDRQLYGYGPAYTRAEDRDERGCCRGGRGRRDRDERPRR